MDAFGQWSSLQKSIFRRTPSNVFWQVGSSSTLGTGTAFAGNLIAFTSDTVTTGVSVAGRVFALGGAVTLENNNITGVGSNSSGGGGGGGMHKHKALPH